MCWQCGQPHRRDSPVAKHLSGYGFTAPPQLLGNAMLTSRDSPFHRFVGRGSGSPSEASTNQPGDPTRPGTQPQLVTGNRAHPFPAPEYTHRNHHNHRIHCIHRIHRIQRIDCITHILVDWAYPQGITTVQFPKRLSYGSGCIFFPIHDSLSEVPLI